MQVWVSCSGGRTTASDPHPLGGDQCGEQRGPDLQHRTTTCETGGALFELGPVPWASGEFGGDTAAYAGLVSYSEGRPTTCDPHVRAGCGEKHVGCSIVMMLLENPGVRLMSEKHATS